jgi:hypothetical protein
VIHHRQMVQQLVLLGQVLALLLQQAIHEMFS